MGGWVGGWVAWSLRQDKYFHHPRGSELLWVQYHLSVHVDGPPPFELVICKVPIM